MEELVATYLSLLANAEQAEIIAFLRQNPALETAKTENGVSLLLMAAYYRKEEVLRYFLERRRSLDFFEAAATGDLAQVEQQLMHDFSLLDSFAADGFTALGLATFFKQASTVEYLLTQGADPNLAADNAMRVAPLHSAVAVESMPIAEMLLAKGADSNLSQQKGITALHSAAHRGNSELAALLLEHGADPKLRAEDGKDAAAFADEAGAGELAKRLRSI